MGVKKNGRNWYRWVKLLCFPGAATFGANHILTKSFAGTNYCL